MAEYRIVVFREYENGDKVPTLAAAVFSDREEAVQHRRFYTELLAGCDPVGRKAAGYTSIVLCQAKAHKLIRDFMESNDKWAKTTSIRAPD